MPISKKFYRNFTDAELDLFEDMREVMERCFVQVPPFVLKRMTDRGIIPNDIELLDEEGLVRKEHLYRLEEVPQYKAIEEDVIKDGMVLEFSNEGLDNPNGPYRIVWALEHGGSTYFVKTPVPPLHGVVRVIDVWRKQGSIPMYPLVQQQKLFVEGANWDIESTLEGLVKQARVQILGDPIVVDINELVDEDRERDVPSWLAG